MAVAFSRVVTVFAFFRARVAALSCSSAAQELIAYSLRRHLRALAFNSHSFEVGRL